MIAVHAGFVKTATSTLQRGVFSQHEGINYLGLPAPDHQLAAAIHAIPKMDSIQFDAELIKALFQSYMNEQKAEQINLLSYENLCLYESKDKGMIAQRLRQIFGDCKVFFTLRRQEDLVKAWYLQKSRKYISGNNFLRFDDWLDIKLQEVEKSIFADLDFDATIRYFEDFFGVQNVEIFLFEHLQRDPAGFAQRMANFLGIDSPRFETLLAKAHFNPTITRRQMAFGWLSTTYVPRVIMTGGRRLVPKKLRKRFNRFLKRGPGATVARSEALENWVADHCRAGNRALNARYANQLACYGYTL